MKHLTSIIALVSLSLMLNLSHSNPANADSLQASTDGSKSLSSGLSTASAGALQLVSGVLSVPALILDGIADESIASRNPCDTCANAFPVADEIIILQSAGRDGD